MECASDADKTHQNAMTARGISLARLSWWNKTMVVRRSTSALIWAPVETLTHIIHDGSSRNRQDALRDGHAEPW